MSDKALFDLHIYTNNTPGGNDKVSFLCETATAKGLRAVAFTDNIDLCLYINENSHRRVRHSYFDMAKAKQLFFGSVMVLAGIEICNPLFDSELCEKIINSQVYDLVLACINKTQGFSDFSCLSSADANTVFSFTEEYFNELKNTVINSNFDVLSKPLAPFRNTVINSEHIKEAIKPVLSELAERNKALELNTRDILGSDKLRNLYYDILCEFRLLGGRYVTIGSESYYHDDIGNGIDLARQTLKRAGFSETAIYDKRLPYTIDL